MILKSANGFDDGSSTVQAEVCDQQSNRVSAAPSAQPEDCGNSVDETDETVGVKIRMKTKTTENESI